MKTTPFIFLLAFVLAHSASADISALDKKYNIKSGSGATTKAATTKSATAKAANKGGKKQTPQPEKTARTVDEGTTLLTGLYNGEEINMPNEVLQVVGDLNNQLEAVLSESDYLAILKGELAWYVGRKASGKRISYDDLKKRLNAILKDPMNDRVFRWPRFLSNSGEGVRCVPTLASIASESRDWDVGYADDRFYFIRSGEASVDVFDVRTGKCTGILSLPSCPMTTVLTRIPRSDMYFLTLSRYMSVGMYEGVWRTAEVGTWQSESTGFASVIDAENGRMQTFMFGSHSPSEFYDPGKCDLFVRSAFPLNEYLRLKPSRGNFDDDEKSSYAYTRSADEYEVSRPSWGDWKEWTGPNSRKGKDKWEPDDLYADKTQRDSYIHYLKDDSAKSIPVQSLNFRTLRLGESARAQTDKIKDLPAYVLEKLGGAFSFVDGWGNAVEWKNVEGLQSNGFVAFTLTSDEFQQIKNIREQLQIAGFITPDGRVYVFGEGKDCSKLFPWNRQKLLKRMDEGDLLSVETIKTPLSFQTIGDNIVSVIWKETNAESGKSIEGRAIIQTIDLSSGKTVSERKFERMPENYDAESGLLVTKIDGNHYRLHKLEEKAVDAGFDYYVSGTNYAIVLPNGHYCGTPGCESMLVYNHAGHSMGMDALAPWRNRPAEVLRALGGSEDDIAALESTTQRWLMRKGMTLGDEEPSLGDFPQSSVALPTLRSESRTCSFNVRLKATAKDICGFQLELDGVPQYVDLKAKGIAVPAGKEKVVKVTVPLIAGQNWIKFTPVDADGLKGDSTRFRTIYAPDAIQPGTLYVVALGVSEYADEGMQLQYASKDATDVVESFQSITGGECKTLLLKDKEVTRDVLKRVRKFLKDAKPEDSVVFYLAGHGLLNSNMDYYYAPATFDPDDIDGSGIPMQEITGVFNYTLARKRLLLLDTCHSGALGEEGEEKMALAMGNLPQGVRAVQHRGMKVKKVDSLSNSNQKKRYIEEMFSMTESVPGVNVISGAAGAEFAMESGEWNNGVFTAALLEALTNSADADANKDGIIRLPELAKYVQNRVAILTNGAQRPSSILTEEAPYFPVAKGLRAYVPQDVVMSGKVEESIQRPTSGNWESFISALQKCRKIEQDFKQIYPDIFSEQFAQSAKQSVLEELERLTGGKTRTEYGALLVQACEQFNPTEILQLLDKGADVNAVDYKGDTPLLIVIKQAERAMLEKRADVDVFIEVSKKLRNAGADIFQENEKGECAADHMESRQDIAVKHALRHIQACNSDTPNQLETELSCYAEYVDFFDKGKVNKSFIRKDAVETDAKFPVRKYHNVRDVESEAIGCSRSDGRYSYHVALTCDCDYTGAKGKKIHMVMRNHYVISFVKGAPQITSIRTIVNPDNNGEKELGILLYEIDADYALPFERTMKEPPYSSGLMGFDENHITRKNSQGRTMLHYACAEGRAMLAKWLLQHGANPDVSDNDGKEPEHYLPIINRQIMTEVFNRHRAGFHK